MPENWDALYEVPIEMLALSDHAVKLVKRVGITTVGDCLDHFSLYSSGAMIQVPSGFLPVMEGEVLRRLVEQGYITPEAAVVFGCTAED